MALKSFPFNKSKKNQQSSKDSSFYFVTAFPKSGSSFIALVLNQLLKYKMVDIIYSHYREQDLYEPKLVEFKNMPTISKHHTLATQPNIALMQQYDIKPIILTRKLSDIIVSLRDHIEKTMRWPHFFIPNDFRSRSTEEQHDLLIEIALPWYLFFYTSWLKVAQEEQIEIEFITYEDFHHDKLGTFKKVFDFWGYSFSDQKILEAIAIVENYSSDKNRMNKGLLNRGQDLLNTHQLNRIKNLANLYPEFEFKPIL